MAALTKTQIIPRAGMGNFERKGGGGGGVRAVYQLSNMSGAAGDTFDVPFLADHVAAQDRAGMSFTIARNSPTVGMSRITTAGGGAAATAIKVEVEGRP